MVEGANTQNYVLAGQTLIAPSLEPALYVVATPIGNLRDITLRARDILACADVLAAEDTRTLRKLMDIHGISLGNSRIMSFHDHNARAALPKVLAAMEDGKSVVYASEAGTPLVSDPGYGLTRAVSEAGLPLVSAPGPTAAIAALTLSGLPSDAFFFAGFLPPKSAKRKSALEALRTVPGTLIFYESPKRVAAMLADAVAVLGEDRPAALCREITKKFEQTLRGPLGEIANEAAHRDIKGEIVVLIERGASMSINEIDLDTVLSKALETATVRDAAEQVAADLGLKKRDVYQRALALSKSD